MTALTMLGLTTDCGVPTGRGLIVVPAPPGGPLFADGTGSMLGVPSAAAAVPFASGRLTVSRSSGVRVPTGASLKTRAAWPQRCRSAPACRPAQPETLEEPARSILRLRCPGQLEWACHRGSERRPEPRRVPNFVGEQRRTDQECGDVVARAPGVVARTARGAAGDSPIRGLRWLVRRAGAVV